MTTPGSPERPLPNTRRATLLGKVLRDYRHKAGLTVSAMGERVGYTRSHISGVERGKSGASYEFISKSDQELMANGELLNTFFPSTDKFEIKDILREASRGKLNENQSTAAELNDAFADIPEVVSEDKEILKLLLRIARRITVRNMQINKPVSICSKEINVRASLINEGIYHLIVSLLSGGVEVDHYLRLDKKNTASSTLANQLLGFLKISDDYKPYSITSHRDSGPVFDFILIPDTIAVLFVSTMEQGGMDTAWVYKDKERIASLAATVELVRNQTISLATLFPIHYEEKAIPQRYERTWEKAILKAEAKGGDNLIVNYGLPSSTELEEVIRKRVSRETNRLIRDEKKAYAIINSVISTKSDRLKAVERQARDFSFKIICPLSSIYSYKRTGRRILYDDILESATKEEFKLHVKHVIDMLKKYPNFELALVDDDFRDQYINLWWEVDGTDKGGTVFLELTRVSGKTSKYAYVALHNVAITNAFRAHFDQIWNKVWPEYKDKKWVIKQLELAIK